MNETNFKKELVELVKNNAEWIKDGFNDEWKLIIYMDSEKKLNLEMVK